MVDIDRFTRRGDMAKRRKTLRVRIPPYEHPRNEWRRAVHAELIAAAQASEVAYNPEDELELSVLLYMDQEQLRWQDVDNRLKDIMDALQGRAGGPKSEHPLAAVVPNDRQILKVTIEKRTPPGQSRGLGHLVIRKHK